jgi:uncharacterized protein (TIGR03067 family)
MRTCGLLLGALATVSLAGLLRADKAKAPAEEKKYRYVKLVHDGKEVTKDQLKDIVLVLHGNKGVVKKGDQVLFEGTSKVNTEKTPWTIDVTVTAGKDKGQTRKGILKMEDGKMMLCWGKAGGKRPTEFKSEKGSGTVYEVLEEIK